MGDDSECGLLSAIDGGGAGGIGPGHGGVDEVSVGQERSASIGVANDFESVVRPTGVDGLEELVLRRMGRHGSDLRRGNCGIARPRRMLRRGAFCSVSRARRRKFAVGCRGG